MSTSRPGGLGNGTKHDSPLPPVVRRILSLLIPESIRAVVLEDVDAEITNRIFSIRLRPTTLDMFEPLRVRVIAESTADKSTVARAAWSSEGWGSEGRIITLVSGEPVDVRLLLDDDSAQELRILVVEVGTDRTIKDTEPIPVRVIQ